MSVFNYGRRRAAALITGSVFGLAMPAALGLSAAQAADNDRDNDGMPNRWEVVNGLNPDRANARGDKDHDGLTNLAEYRRGANPADEDSDHDGHDDGDEVTDGYRSTDVKDKDTDDDGALDGDEDTDRDGIDNEDEDDAREGCRGDDDDRDRDNVDNEDENELGSAAGDVDSDNDGTLDGEEDADHDGEANEDEDDVLGDRCEGDFDGDGETDEDEDDVLGTVLGYDDSTGTLTVETAANGPVSFVLTEDTEIKWKHSNDLDDGSDDRSATTTDLQPGVVVAELDVDDNDGALKEIKIYQP